MMFASVYVPDFMLQSVIRAEPALRDHWHDRPMALVEGNPPLSKVIAANKAALQAGIQLGMGASQAAQFGAADIRQRSQSQEKTARAALLDVGWSMSPRIEDTAPDTMVVDLAGLISLFKSVDNIALALTERAFNVSLQAHVAVACDIEVAIHAARGFSGITLIPPGEESKRLHSLPIEILSPSAETLETLSRWGIRTCGALAPLPLLQLSERLGQEGIRLQALARGISCRSLVLAEPETCFSEEMALDYTVTELEPLAFLLGRLLDQLCARLEARSLAASAFCLRFNLQDLIDLQDCVEEDLKIKKNIGPSGSGRTYEKILRLPVPMRDSKTLLKLLRLQLQSDPPHGSIVKIVLTAEPARPRAGQKGLFIPDSPDPEKLEVTIARLAGLVGDANVGSPQLLDTHRPGQFRMVPFLSISEESTLHRKVGAKNRTSHDGSLPKSRRRPVAIAFRTFRPELPANVESRDQCPCRIGFRGMCGNVVAASGPWRSSGDWWEKHGWRQDEWDVELRFHSVAGKQAPGLRAQDGIYRIYYDWMRRGWFVRGRYD
jgi:protein ImuB